MEGIKNILHDDNFKSAEFELQPYIDNLSKKKKKYDRYQMMISLISSTTTQDDISNNLDKY